MLSRRLPPALSALKPDDPASCAVALEKGFDTKRRRWVWCVYRIVHCPRCLSKPDAAFPAEHFDDRPDAKARAQALADAWGAPIHYEGPQR